MDEQKLDGVFEQRKQFAIQVLYPLINQTQAIKIEDQSDNVIAITADWGLGKTRFLTAFKDALSHDLNLYPVYYNAWKNDYDENPLYSIVTTLNTQLMVKNKTISEKTKELFTLALAGANTILKITGKKSLSDLIKIPKEALEEAQKVCVGESIIEESELSQAVDKFKNHLQNFQKSFNKKIVIFIDELDRCNPVYSITLLEMIKHFFDIDGFSFVFAICKSQLEVSVRNSFGSDIDTTGYLSKFFDYELRLPEPDKKEYIAFIQTKIQPSKNPTAFNLMSKCCFHVMETNDFYSLRDINKFALMSEMLGKMRFNVSSITSPQFFLDIIAIVLNVKNRALFEKYFLRQEPLIEGEIIGFKEWDKYNFQAIQQGNEKVTSQIFYSITQLLNIFLHKKRDDYQYTENDHILRMKNKPNLEIVIRKENGNTFVLSNDDYFQDIPLIAFLQS